MAETEARFLRAAGDLREMAEWEPERARAFERLGSEASEESWQEAQRFLRAPGEQRARTMDFLPLLVGTTGTKFGE